MSGVARACRSVSLGISAAGLGAALLTACGETAAPSPTAAGAPAVRPATQPAAPTAASATPAAPTSAPAAAPTTAAPPAPAAGLAMVSAVDNRFEPVSLEVPVGTTVRWTNNGREDHDVVSSDFKTFESPVLKPGQTFEFTAAQAGQVPYVCTLHEGMTAMLVVR